MCVGGQEGALHGVRVSDAVQEKRCVYTTSEDWWGFVVFSFAYPSGPLQHLSVDDPQLFLLKAVLQVFGPTGVVDKDGQQDHGSLEEEVQRRPEVEEEEGEGGNQNGGDLARQHVEHVVSELQDEGHR